MLRVFRVLRILRLLKGAKGVRDLLMTLVLSFPALVNVFGLLALCMFIYSILGVQLFTFVMRGDNLTDDRNFDTFGQAALLLFQVITGDGWSGLMEDCMVDQARGCDPAEGNCGSWVALPCFLTYLLIATFVVINLVIAVVLENFTMLGSQDPNMITGNDIDVFKEVWAEFDPDANGMVPVVDLPALVARVPPPLGLGGVDQRKCARFCMNLEISPVNGEVKFKDMLDALVNKNFAEHGEELPTDAAAAAKVIEERKRSISRGESLGRGKALAAGSAPLSARQKAMAQLFAEQLLTMFIRRKRAQSADGKLKIGKSPTREGRAPKSNVSTVPGAARTPSALAASAGGHGRTNAPTPATRSPAALATRPSALAPPPAATGPPKASAAGKSPGTKASAKSPGSGTAKPAKGPAPKK